MKIEQTIKAIREKSIKIGTDFAKGRAENPLVFYDSQSELIIQALQEMQSRSHPKPLSLEELRGMEGKPVWVVPADNSVKPFWKIQQKTIAMFGYGEDWLACPTEPKEVK